MSRIRRSISPMRSASSWITPPRYRSYIVCLCLCRASSITNGGARDALGPVFAAAWSEPVRPAASKTVAMTHHFIKPLYLFRDNSCVVGVEHPHTALRTHANGSSTMPAPSSSRWTGFCTMPSSSLKRTRATCNAASKNILTSNDDSAQPCRSPCVTSNHSWC